MFAQQYITTTNVLVILRIQYFFEFLLLCLLTRVVDDIFRVSLEVIEDAVHVHWPIVHRLAVEG